MLWGPAFRSAGSGAQPWRAELSVDGGGVCSGGEFPSADDFMLDFGARLPGFDRAVPVSQQLPLAMINPHVLLVPKRHAMIHLCRRRERSRCQWNRCCPPRRLNAVWLQPGLCGSRAASRSQPARAGPPQPLAEGLGAAAAPSRPGSHLEGADVGDRRRRWSLSGVWCYGEEMVPVHEKKPNPHTKSAARASGVA